MLVLRGKLIIPLAIFSIVFFLCTEKEPLPNYIQIESFTLTSDYENEGSASSNIKDVWVFLNDNSQGVYELPTKFPVIIDDTSKIEIFPGIFINGISNTRVEYPFYKSYTFDLKDNPNLTDIVTPITTYVDNATFKLIEDFEIGNSFTNINRVDGDDVFQGTFSGKLNIDSTTGSVFVASTILNYSITPLTPAAFIELDYKNNHPFELYIVPIIPGLQGAPEFISGINTSDVWNKIYLNLTPIANRFQADEYQIQLVVKTNGVSPENIEVFIDNFKLIHF